MHARTGPWAARWSPGRAAMPGMAFTRSPCRGRIHARCRSTRAEAEGPSGSSVAWRWNSASFDSKRMAAQQPSRTYRVMTASVSCLGVLRPPRARRAGHPRSAPGLLSHRVAMTPPSRSWKASGALDGSNRYNQDFLRIQTAGMAVGWRVDEAAGRGAARPRQARDAHVGVARVRTTAAEVTERATLEAPVEGAKEYIEELQPAGTQSSSRPRAVLQIQRSWKSTRPGPNGSSGGSSPVRPSVRRVRRRRSCLPRRDSGTWADGRSDPASLRRSLAGRSIGSTRGRATTLARSSPGLGHSRVRVLYPSQGTRAMMHARWSRHAVSIPAIVFGAWYGVEHGSRGAFVVAGAGALAWLVWPEASRLLAWRRARRSEAAKTRLERSLRRAERDVAKAERARRRANRRPSSARRARRAARMEARAERALATAVRSRDRASANGDKPSPP